MSNYLQISENRYIEWNDESNRTSIINIEELEQHKAELERRIGMEDPNVPKTDEEWIAYGKASYKYVDHSTEQSELDRVNSVLLAIKNL
jgi:hypothetical protein